MTQNPWKKNESEKKIFKNFLTQFLRNTFIKIIKWFSIFEKVNFLRYKFFPKKIKNWKIEQKVPKTAFGDPKTSMVHLFCMLYMGFGSKFQKKWFWYIFKNVKKSIFSKNSKKNSKTYCLFYFLVVFQCILSQITFLITNNKDPSRRIIWSNSTLWILKLFFSSC